MFSCLLVNFFAAICLAAATPQSHWEELLYNTTSHIEIAWNSRHTYSSASPYPHAVFDGLFSHSFLKDICNEIIEDPNEAGCISGSTRCVKGVNARFKSAINRESLMGSSTSMMLNYLKSSRHIDFLEKLTGITNLIPDPGYFGSGIHVTSRHGFLKVHADFNWYKKYSLSRRVNTFLYLNPDWNETFGGHLEMWNKDLNECPQKILPAFGRYVVFSTTDFSYHGHPEPLAAPPGRSRRSLALYYYSNDQRPRDECLQNNCSKAHSTLYKNIPHRCDPSIRVR